VHVNRALNSTVPRGNEKEVTAPDPCSSSSNFDVVRHSSRIDVGWCWAVHRALIPERNRTGDRSWTVLDIRRVGENCRASIFLRRLNQFYYFLLVKSFGSREEEESRSDNQEQEDIDGTGEVEH
jgi:hypothetical protein